MDSELDRSWLLPMKPFPEDDEHGAGKLAALIFNALKAQEEYLYVSGCESDLSDVVIDGNVDLLGVAQCMLWAMEEDIRRGHE